MLPEITRSDVFRLEARRLWLRWPEPGDAAAVTAFAARKEVATMTASWPHPLPEGEVARRIKLVREGNARGRALTLAIVMKPAPGAAIGLVGGRFEDGPADGFGIGYMLALEHWGQGLMSEALAAYRDTILRLTDVPRLTAYVRTINPASQRVLAKTGFRRVATTTMEMVARGPGIEVDRFVLERNWRSRQDCSRT